MAPNPGRVPPLSPDELPEDQQRALGGWKDLSFTRVLLRHPERYATFVRHMGALVNGTSLPPRDRQIVILRTLELCGDDYEKAHHLVISRRAGLSETETDAILAGGGDVLSEHDHALLRATLELHQQQCIEDETWSAVGDGYTLEQQMEVVYLAGCFHTVAMATKTFGIEIEPDLQQFDDLRNPEER